MNKDIVTITCYGQTEKMERKKALKFYRECASFSEGSEHERYCNIILDLLDGKSVAHDIH